MATATRADALQSLLQRQLVAQEDILDAQKTMLEIQREIQSCWSSLVVQNLGIQESLCMPSGDDDGPCHVAGASRCDVALNLESGEDTVVEPRDEVPPCWSLGNGDGTWGQVYARVLSNPVAAHICPPSGMNQFKGLCAASPAPKLEDFMSDFCNLSALYNMLLYTITCPWWTEMQPPETAIGLIVYLSLLLVVVANHMGVTVSVILTSLLKGVHHSNLHTWLRANWRLIKLDGVLRVSCSWGTIVVIVLRSAIDLVGDELPSFLLSKPSNGIRLAAWIFSTSVVFVVISVSLAFCNVACYTQIYSGAQCHTPVASAQDVQKDGGVSKLFAATVAGHKLGTADLEPLYVQSRRQQERDYKLSHQHKQSSRRSSLRRRPPPSGQKFQI